MRCPPRHGYLEEALQNATPPSEYLALRRDIYRALVLNWEAFGNSAKTLAVLRDWRNEHPDDPDVATESEPLEVKF